MAFSLTQQSQVNKYHFTIGLKAENSWELDTDWDRTVWYCQASTFFFNTFSRLLPVGLWLLQKRYPFSKRDLANALLSKMQIYWIYASKCLKSIGLLLGQALISLLRVWSSGVPAKRGHPVMSLGTGSLLCRAALGHLKELANSERGTVSLREVAPPTSDPL